MIFAILTFIQCVISFILIYRKYVIRKKSSLINNSKDLNYSNVFFFSNKYLLEVHNSSTHNVFQTTSTRGHNNI